MRRFWRIVSLSIVAFMVLIDCESDYCLKGSGESKSLQIILPAFDTLVVNGIFDVILIEDSLGYIEFVGGENQLEMVSADLRQASLWLENSNHCFIRPEEERVKVYVHVNHLNSLMVLESSHIVTEGPLTTIQSADIRAKITEIDIELDRTGFICYMSQVVGGNLIFRGKADRFTLMVFYTMNCDLTRLETSNMIIKHDAVTDLYVRPSDKLRVSIYNRGSVFYAGTPEVLIDTLAGSGQVLPWSLN